MRRIFSVVVVLFVLILPGSLIGGDTSFSVNDEYLKLYAMYSVSGVKISEANVVAVYDKSNSSFILERQSGLLPDYVNISEKLVLDDFGLVVTVDRNYSYKILLPMKVNSSFIAMVNKGRIKDRKLYEYSNLGLQQLPLEVHLPSEYQLKETSVMVNIDEYSRSIKQSVYFVDRDSIVHEYVLYLSSSDVKLESLASGYVIDRRVSVGTGLLPYMIMQSMENYQSGVSSSVDSSRIQAVEAERANGDLELMYGDYSLGNVFLPNIFWNKKFPDFSTTGEIFMKNNAVPVSIYSYREKEAYFIVGVYGNRVVELSTNTEFKFGNLKTGISYANFSGELWGLGEDGKALVPEEYKRRSTGSTIKTDFVDGMDAGVIAYGFTKVGKDEVLTSISIRYTDLWNNGWGD
jgi:hypothetical protein